MPFMGWQYTTFWANCSAIGRNACTWFCSHGTARPCPLRTYAPWAELLRSARGDLRFTPEESAAFLAKVLKAPLSQSAVTLLDQRIEGWIAGLRLATVSLRTAVDAEMGVASGQRQRHY